MSTMRCMHGADCKLRKNKNKLLNREDRQGREENLKLLCVLRD